MLPAANLFVLYIIWIVSLFAIFCKTNTNACALRDSGETDSDTATATTTAKDTSTAMATATVSDTCSIHKIT